MKIYIYTFYQETILFFKNSNKIIEKKITNKQISKVFYNVIEEIFTKINKSYSDIEYISFINGPGSFTSLRFFLSYVKALHVSYPNIKIIPINLLEMIAFSKTGKSDVVMGGTRVFSDYFHHAKYYKSDEDFKIIEDVSIKPKNELKNLNPIYIGVDPDFKVVNYEFNFDNLYKFSEYKLNNNFESNIDLLTPFYYKGHGD